MSDDIPNTANDKSESAQENAIEPQEQTPPPKKTDAAKPSVIGSLLLKLWNAVMMICTAILSIFVFIRKDESATPYFVLGIIGLCIPPMVSMIRAANIKRERQRELDEQIRKAEIERIRQAREREIERENERLKMQEAYADKEIADQEAIGNIDVQAFKINSSME